MATLESLDGTNPCPRTVWIITANYGSSRREANVACLTVKFQAYGAGAETVALLERIWSERAPQGAEKTRLQAAVQQKYSASDSKP